MTGKLPRRRTWLVVAAGLAVLVGLVAWAAYEQLLRRDIPVYANDSEHFKFGSIGNDGGTGIPYPIWIALPKVFPQYLPGPGGYASFGFVWEAGHAETDAPIGFSRARVGVERMAINCAVCHTTAYRMSPDAPRQVALGGVSNTVDILSYQRFLTAAARDPRFNADTLLPAMEEYVDLSLIDRLVYRLILIPLTRDGLLAQGDAFAWAETRPEWGPGRIDPFNPVKFDMLDLPDDGTIGNSDMQAVWGLDARLRIRPDAPLHWDGLNTSVREVALSSALGDGMTANEYGAQTKQSLRRIERFLRRTNAPASPYRPDPDAARRGYAIYAATCGECHEAGGARMLTVIPVSEVGTDHHRAAMWTDAARDAYNGYRTGYAWGFSRFRNVEGYVAEPLDGLWARAPYLHNGSVPTLADLLLAPPDRPATFLRGLEVLDPARGGFIAPTCNPAGPQGGGFCFDARVAGNSNAGHLYGTTLSTSEKADLLAYLLSR